MASQPAASPAANQLTGEVSGVELRQASLADLDGEHRRLLVQAVERILCTEIAEVTYAQIIDGLPIADVAYDTRSPPYGAHPLDERHEELCPGMLEKAREFRAGFQPDILTFKAKLLHEYRACAPGSRAFKTFLIELVAVAIHQIAAVLYELDTSVHKDDGVTEWAPPKSDEFYWKHWPNGPLPSLFHHRFYKDYDQYPRGVADMVGYWAEGRIFGGVVLFDRRDPSADPAADPHAIYFHPDREALTYRIYQLLPEQRAALLDFLLADEPSSTNPLPILGDKNNRIRVDPEEPIEETGIYRDLWERRYVPVTRADYRLRDVIAVGRDFISMEDWGASHHRARMRLREEESALSDTSDPEDEVEAT